MGLYDYVRCEYPLPDLPDPTAIEFQTKSFPDPFLDQYRISREGRLLRTLVRIEDMSDHNAPAGSLERVSGSMTRVPIGEEDLLLHGDIDFYASRDEDSAEWFEYRARFTHGVLESVKRIPDHRTDPEQALSHPPAGGGESTSKEQLQEAVAWAYQAIGARWPNEQALDNLSAVLEGKKAPHEWPVVPASDEDELRAQLQEAVEALRLARHWGIHRPLCKSRQLGEECDCWIGVVSAVLAKHPEVKP